MRKSTAKRPLNVVRTYTRHYFDNGQTTTYVEWSDGSRTEGQPTNAHMALLLARAKREGRPHAREEW